MVKTSQNVKDFPTSLIPCSNCKKEWPLNSLIYLEVPTGQTANLCSWLCVWEYAQEQIQDNEFEEDL